MFCTSCGMTVNDTDEVCQNCGKVLKSTVAATEAAAPAPVAQETPVQPAYTAPAAPAYQQPVYQQPAYQAAPYAQPMYQQTIAAKPSKIPTPEMPVSLGSWIGTLLLCLVPIVNIIMLIVWAVSAKKASMRNFARAYWIVIAITLVISIVIGILFGAALGSLLYY